MNELQVKPAWGPKMAALPNDRWRAFVIAFLDGARDGPRHGKGYTAAARRAGFKGNNDTLSQTGGNLAHDQRIQEAIQEEARKRMVETVPIALEALAEISADRLHKDRLGAARTILDRTGLHEIRETKNTHEITGNAQLVERIRQLAVQMGVPLERLLGHGGMERLEPPKLALTVDFEEVKADV